MVENSIYVTKVVSYMQMQLIGTHTIREIRLHVYINFSTLIGDARWNFTVFEKM